MAETGADFAELQLLVDSFERQGRSLSRLMPAVAEVLVAAVSDVYDAEGPGWEPLKEATLKKRRGTVGKILQDTGVMAGSTSAGYGSDFAEARGGASYSVFHAPDDQGRNPFDLGPFEEPALREIEEMLLDELLKGAAA